MFANIDFVSLLICLSVAFTTCFLGPRIQPAAMQFTDNCRLAMISFYPDATLSRARELKENKDFDAAITQYRNYLAKMPENAYARAEYAYCFNANEDFPRALQEANLALYKQADNIDALSNKAWALNHLKRFDEALKTADFALSKNSTDGESWCARGEALMGLGRFKEAAVALERHKQIHGAEYFSEQLRKTLYERLGTKMPEDK